MKLISAALLAPVLAAGVALGAPGAAHAETTPGTPDATGSYKLDHTSGYLVPNQAAMDIVADFKVTQVAESNSVASARTINPGDGSPDQPWTSGTTITLRYNDAGTYTPVVTLKDADGDTTTVKLSTVKVLNDTVAPKIATTKPSKATKAGSWKVVRGTTSDVGTGVAGVIAFVMEKRGNVWYAYDFSKKKWLKGYSNVKKTEAKSKAEPYIAYNPGPTWKTPTIKGLKKGTLRIQAVAVDNMGNYTEARIVTQRVK